MNAAFLFNADHFYGHGNYAIAANTIVFRTGVIQELQRHMKMGRGDVSTFGHARTMGNSSPSVSEYTGHPDGFASCLRS